MRLLRIVAPVVCVLAVAVTRPAAPSPGVGAGVAGGDDKFVCRLYLDPHDYFTRVVSPRTNALMQSGVVLSTITVNYTGFTPQAQAAFQAAVDIWKTQVSSPVPMVVNATFADLGNTGLLGQAGFSGLYANFSGAPLLNVLYPGPIANKLSNVDRNGASAEIGASFNSTANWSYATDGVPVSGKVDFISVVLHELGHGLGFIGSGTISNGLGRIGSGGTPYAYDVSVVDSAGTSILNAASYPNNSAALAALIQGTGLSGPGLFWNGANGVAANAGMRPRLYAPAAIQPGSSFSHLDDATYPAGNINSLMTHAIGSAEVIHTPGPIVNGIFADMGWGSQCSFGLNQTVASVPAAGGTVNVTLSTTAGCPWTASTASAFVTITLPSPATGNASSVIRMTVTANASAAARVATVVIGDQTLTIAQAGTTPCSYSLAASSANVPAAASAGSVALTAATGCAWTAASSDFTIATITNSPANGQGSAAIGYAVSANSAPTERSATLTVGGQAFTITQAGTVPLPSMTLDRSALFFGAVTTGASFTSQTAGQTVRLTQSGPAGTVTWTASSSVPWLVVSPTSGTGPAAFTLTTPFMNGLAATESGAVTLTFTGAANVTAQITATLRTMASAQAMAPNGAFDTPANLSSGLTGSFPVTGWATDDVDVARVRILRDAVAGEPAGALVFIGNAVLVEGARPDVQATFPTSPRSYRAGWGYLLLSTFLPALGNGTFRLTAIADDADGHSTVLGSKTITCANSTATAPFGAIDTPAQGETVAGTVNNFGWVLSPGSRRSDPPGGGTVRVVIDGAIGAAPGGWTSRADLTSLFPAAGFDGIGGALGVAVIDTTALANGVHTISWLVTDNLGSASGIGSRYFTVSNGSGLTVDSESFRLKAEGLGGGWSGGSLIGRRGFDLATPYRTFEPDANGRITIQAEELDRIELLSLPAVALAKAESLPIGSRIDPVTGTFTWHPGVAFVGAYDLVLGGRDVRIVLNPKGSGRVGPQTVIDLPSPSLDPVVSAPDPVVSAFRRNDSILVAGWAADLDSGIDTGVDTVHVWAYPTQGGDPIFVGAADYGGARPDVAAIYGARFLKSGYGLVVKGLAPGTYDLAVFAYSTVRGGFVPAKTVRIVVR